MTVDEWFVRGPGWLAVVCGAKPMRLGLNLTAAPAGEPEPRAVAR